MRKLKRIKSKPKKVDKTTYNPTSNRRTRLIKEWSSLEPNFTHHSVLLVSTLFSNTEITI